MADAVGRNPLARLPAVGAGRSSAPPLNEIAARHRSRDAAIAAAHATSAYGYQRIAEAFGVHFTTVGRIVPRGTEGTQIRHATMLDLTPLRVRVTPVARFGA